MNVIVILGFNYFFKQLCLWDVMTVKLIHTVSKWYMQAQICIHLNLLLSGVDGSTMCFHLTGPKPIIISLVIMINGNF